MDEKIIKKISKSLDYGLEEVAEAFEKLSESLKQNAKEIENCGKK